MLRLLLLLPLDLHLRFAKRKEEARSRLTRPDFQPVTFHMQTCAGTTGPMTLSGWSMRLEKCKLEWTQCCSEAFGLKAVRVSMISRYPIFIHDCRRSHRSLFHNDLILSTRSLARSRLLSLLLFPISPIVNPRLPPVYFPNICQRRPNDPNTLSQQQQQTTRTREMYTLIPLLLSAIPALASSSSPLLARNALLPRQGGDSFIPGTSGIVYDCAEADLCNAGNVCLDRPRGDVCCTEDCTSFSSLKLLCPLSPPQSNVATSLTPIFLADGCPGGNFCLTQGYCCPDVGLSFPTIPLPSPSPHPHNSLTPPSPPFRASTPPPAHPTTA